MARNEPPEDKIVRLMRGAMNEAPKRAGGMEAVHIRQGNGATYVAGDMIRISGGDAWMGIRRDQARCRRLVAEIECELEEMTATELQQTLAWVRRVTGRNTP